MAQVSRSKQQKKVILQRVFCIKKSTTKEGKREEVPHHHLYPRSSSYHSAPVPVIMRREWKHSLIRAVWCATHKLITGSEIERPVSALLSNFLTEAMSRDVVSFVTSVLAFRNQSKAS